MPYLHMPMGSRVLYIPVSDLTIPAWRFMREHIGPLVSICDQNTVGHCILNRKDNGLLFDYANRNRPLSDFIQSDKDALYFVFTLDDAELNGNASPDELPTCSICWGMLDSDHVSLPCAHKFHAACIEKQRGSSQHKTATTCALCRAPFA